jgi:hypothetical protein
MHFRNRTVRRRIRKSIKRRYRKQKGGGDPILPEDIVYQDKDVCIIKPGVKKGVLVFTDYVQPKGVPSLCESGLKSGAQLHSEGVNFGRVVYHPYILFRAPYLSDPIDYTSVDTEITSSFGAGAVDMPSRVWIRVDPDNTYVYSSEIRAKKPHYAVEVDLQQSRKTLTQYLQILTNNQKIKNGIGPGMRPVYHLYSSMIISVVPIVPMADEDDYDADPYAKYPFDNSDISRNSEVLVRLPHLTSDYFVKCT